MYCKYCGNQAAEDQAFCQSCGASLRTNGPAATQAPQPAPYTAQAPQIPQAPANIPQARQMPPYDVRAAAPKSVLGPVAAITAIVVLTVCAASYFLFFAPPKANENTKLKPKISQPELAATSNPYSTTAGSAQQSSSTNTETQTESGTETEAPATTAAPTDAISGAQDLPLNVRLAGAERTGLYTGEVNAAGLPHGQGLFVEGNNAERSYEGSWVNGAASGTGILFEGRYIFEGTFANGSTNGYCKISVDGITRYEGNCQNGQLHGQGTLYTKTGTLIYQGEFSGDMLLETAAAREARGLAFAEQCAGMDESLYETAMSGEDLFGQAVVVWGDVLGLSEQNANGTIIIGHMGDETYPVSLLYRYGTDEAKVNSDQYLNAWGVMIGHFEYEDADGLMTSCPLVEVIYLRPDPAE